MRNKTRGGGKENKVTRNYDTLLNIWEIFFLSYGSTRQILA